MESESESWMPNSNGDYSHESTQKASLGARGAGDKFRLVPTAKNKAIWRLNFYHYLWLAYFSKWAVIMVVSTYYIFSFLIAITEVYPESIKKPASVIAITAVAAPFKGFLHLILYRLSDVPKQYYTYIVWLLWAMGIIETLFKLLTNGMLLGRS
ncbi:hypothetical protein P167DRAFT_549998 [Morchella conica CCBAS932]|uniref:Uncharacterized protein n=1 Tax=Morchella conica CCBAS932 TaxID=1392247 RepID=A0A3N4KCT7_9PEZI|nr:hypothetical protein P167DRAFT_549998 [Morchella conica CCBAS932]